MKFNVGDCVSLRYDETGWVLDQNFGSKFYVPYVFLVVTVADSKGKNPYMVTDMDGDDWYFREDELIEYSLVDDLSNI